MKNQSVTARRTSLLMATAAAVVATGSMLFAPQASAQACVAGQTTNPDGTVAACSGAAQATKTGENADAEPGLIERAVNALTGADEGAACVAGQTTNPDGTVASCAGAAQAPRTGENAAAAGNAPAVSTTGSINAESDAPTDLKVDEADTGVVK